MTLETATGITCAIIAIVLYIYLKATGEMWYGINWKLVFKHIRKLWH